MSEHQYVAFRAIDGPVNDKNLKYMQRQSSRAQITRWSFENEYHFGDFRGNAIEMLQRGYEIHLHYANYGIRNLYIRLPNGFPDSKAARPYIADESMQLVKDKKGRGATLVIQPFYEPGDLNELWDLSEMLERLIPLRSELLDGDLRPLYLAHLAICRDGDHDPEETPEAPVPAGLQEPTDAQLALADLYEISEALIAAAAQNSAPLPSSDDVTTQYGQWLSGQAESTKDEWLVRLLSDPSLSVRTEILTEFRKYQHKPTWPTDRAERTIAQLEAVADEIQQAADKKAAAKAARARAKKLANMAADPKPYLRKTEQLVAERSIDAYRQVSELLAELREALTDSDQSGLAERQARKLKDKNPTLRHLTAALRREGFVPK